MILAFLAAVFFLKWDAIFQRENPIPYLAAALQLSGSNPHVAAGGLNGIYISKRGDKDAFFQMIQDTYEVEHKDQLGSSYLFSDMEKTILSVLKSTGVDLQFEYYLKLN